MVEMIFIVISLGIFLIIIGDLILHVLMLCEKEKYSTIPPPSPPPKSTNYRKMLISLTDTIKDDPIMTVALLKDKEFAEWWHNERNR